MGANIDVAKEASSLGILKENAYTFESSNEMKVLKICIV